MSRRTALMVAAIVTVFLVAWAARLPNEQPISTAVVPQQTAEPVERVQTPVRSGFSRASPFPQIVRIAPRRFELPEASVFPVTVPDRMPMPMPVPSSTGPKAPTSVPAASPLVAAVTNPWRVTGVFTDGTKRLFVISRTEREITAVPPQKLDEQWELNQAVGEILTLTHTPSKKVFTLAVTTK